MDTAVAAATAAPSASLSRKRTNSTQGRDNLKRAMRHFARNRNNMTCVQRSAAFAHVLQAGYLDEVRQASVPRTTHCKHDTSNRLHVLGNTPLNAHLAATLECTSVGTLIDTYMVHSTCAGCRRAFPHQLLALHHDDTHNVIEDNYTHTMDRRYCGECSLHCEGCGALALPNDDVALAAVGTDTDAEGARVFVHPGTTQRWYVCWWCFRQYVYATPRCVMCNNDLEWGSEAVYAHARYDDWRGVAHAECVVPCAHCGRAYSREESCDGEYFDMCCDERRPTPT